MIKGAIKLFLLLVVGLLAYNYFLGTPEEKAQAKETIGKVTELTKEVGKVGVDLIKTEKEKFDAGKYDNALDKIGGLVDKLKSKAQDSKAFMDRVKDLEDKKEELKARLKEDTDKDGEMAEVKQDSLQQEMKDLMQEIENLAKNMEEKE